MKSLRTLSWMIIALAAPATANAQSGATRSGAKPATEAPLIDATGRNQGTVTIASEGTTTRISVMAMGLTPGPHGMHLHAVGKCDTPDFASAGGHWNPDHKQHGHANPMGPHKGDLPQIAIDGSGMGKAEFVVNDTIANVIDADGVALIIHAGQDDDKTDPSGNSGARQLCAAFVAPPADSPLPH